MKLLRTLILGASLLIALALSAAACPVHFSYDAGGETWDLVMVSGSFNGWGSTPDTAWVMNDDNGDGVWEVSTDHPEGAYEYKFILQRGSEQTWIPDPGNPTQVPDGYGGYNSVLILECAGSFTVVSHQTDSRERTFQATLEFTGGQGGLDPASVSGTLDWEPLPPGAIQVNGNTVELQLSGLEDGIHDVRIIGQDNFGQLADTRLLKVLINREAGWEGDVLYFAMTDRFANGNPGNDAPIPGCDPRTNYMGGDFAGITAKIESGYFDQLGVTAIWISWPGDNADNAEDGYYIDSDDCGLYPGGPWPTQHFLSSAYHGYWPKNLYDTEEHFGTWTELRELVRAAHRRGIRVLLDLVINHVHEDSPFFTDNPSSFFNYPMEICQEIGWSRPITCWFTSFLPDLNYGNPEVVYYMLEMCAWWALETGCDGYRVDAVKHVEFDFVRRLRTRMREEMEGTGVPFYMVGETFSGNPDDIAAFLGPDLLQGQFDFPLNLHILKAFAKDEESLGEMDSLFRSFRQTYGNAYSGFLMSNFLGNHDIARFISLAGGQLWCPIWDSNSHASQGWRHEIGRPTSEDAYQRLRLAFTYLMTVPGIPLIYYGDEFGMPGGGDPDNRRMMIFDGLTDWESDTRSYVGLLGRVRRGHPVLGRGELPPPYIADDRMLAFARKLPEQVAVVGINKGYDNRWVSIPAGRLGLENGDQLTDALSGQTITVENNTVEFTVLGRQAVIFLSESAATPTPTPTAPPGTTYTPTPSPTPSPTPTSSPTPGFSPSATPISPTPVTPIPTGTPLPPGGRIVDLQLNSSMFQPGDPFDLKLLIANLDETIDVDLFVFLDFFGTYFFWPAWNPEVDYETLRLDAGSIIQRQILEFTWPQTPGGMFGIIIWAGMLESGAVELVGNVDFVSFGWF
jgi:glycosidase